MGQDVGCSGLVVVKKQATIFYLEEGRKSAQEPKTALEFLQQKNPLPKNGCKRGSSDVRQDACTPGRVWKKEEVLDGGLLPQRAF